MRLVLDTSVVVDLLLKNDPSYQQIRHYVQSAEWLLAPHLMDVESAQVLRKLVLRGDISVQRAEAAIADLQDLPIERYPHAEFMARVFELRNNLTAYDALYLAIAEAADAVLLTRDAAFAGISGASVIVLD